MNPPQNRSYPVPFVKHSVSTGQLPVHHPQPPIVMDYQRLVEHMKAEFRGELQAFKTEILAALRTEQKPAVINNSVTSEVTAETIERMLKRVLGEMGPRETQRSSAQASPQNDSPLYVPSDLLAPLEGSVTVKTTGEDKGNLDDAASMLRKVKKGQK